MTERPFFDYVIVGAGTAGCLLANRLSAKPDARVLLLEAGGRDDYIWINIPVGYLYCIGNPRTDWCFWTAEEKGLGGRSIRYPRGRVLGGCSSINGMIYMRGQAADYDRWRQMGNAGWGWDDVLPYFKRHEDYQPGADEFHGAGGEWRIEKMRVRWEILDAFADACEAAGIPRIEDFNRGDNFGVAPFMVTQRKGWRWNTAQGFLRPVAGRPNLVVETGAQATRIVLEDGRATGLAYRQNGGARQVAAGEIVLAAGAIGSPHLLQLSGIGPGEVLRDNGIGVRHELRGVGENLQDHLQIRCAYRVEGVETLNQRAGSWLGKAGIALEYAVKRSGPMSMAPSQLGVFAKSSETMETPDLEYHVQPLSLEAFGGDLHDFPAFTASVCNLRPTSRGTVRLTGPDPDAAPEIRPNYLSTAADRQTAANAIRLTRHIVGQLPLRPYNPQEFKPEPGTPDSDAALAEAAGRIGTTIFHPVGTAKMGQDPMAVVDDRLRVHGVAGLRVADASIMPTITSGNTNAPTLMIAEKAAEMVLADR